MIDEVPPFNSLTDKEIQAIEALLGGPQKHTRNGHAIDVGRGLLKKAVIKNLEEFVSQLHQELIHSTASDKVKQSVDHILKTQALGIFRCSSLYATPNPPFVMYEEKLWLNLPCVPVHNRLLPTGSTL